MPAKIWRRLVSQHPATLEATPRRSSATWPVLDLTNEERPDYSLAIQVSLSRFITAKESCIITAVHTLQKMVALSDSFACEIPGLPSSCMESIKDANTQLDDFIIYSDGFFAVLLPRDLAAEYRQDLRLAHCKMRVIAKPKTESKPSCWSRVIAQCNKFFMPLPLGWKSANFLTLLKNLLAKTESTAWNIFATGHGASREYTCGLTEASFKQLLKFLATGINTRMLVYESCYAAGKMRDYIYEDGIIYPYLILCQGVGDCEGGGEEYESAIFKVASNIKNINDAHEIAGLLPKPQYGVTNIFQIRLPRSKEFIIPPLTSNGTVSTLCIDNNTSAEQLNNPSAPQLILNTTYIPTSLGLPINAKLYNALRGDCWQYLRRMDAQHLSREHFLALLHSFGEYNNAAQQILLIDEVALKNENLENCIAFRNSPAPEPAKAISKPTIFFMKDGQGHIEHRRSAGKVIFSTQTTLSEKGSGAYIDLFNQLHSRILQGRQPRRLTDYKFMRQLAALRPCLKAGYLMTSGLGGYLAQQGVASLLGDTSCLISAPVSLTIGLGAVMLAVEALHYADRTICTKLRYMDLAKKQIISA